MDFYQKDHRVRSNYNIQNQRDMAWDAKSVTVLYTYALNTSSMSMPTSMHLLLELLKTSLETQHKAYSSQTIDLFIYLFIRRSINYIFQYF
ncbi:hypothetical protein BpHYR1_014961, partial [Brachionus plicatilis]